METKKSKKSRFNAWKFACGYLRRSKDFGTFFAFLFLWKRRKQMPLVEKKEEVQGFIYPH